jgi:hypothetical protein
LDREKIERKELGLERRRDKTKERTDIKNRALRGCWGREKGMELGVRDEIVWEVSSKDRENLDCTCDRASEARVCMY